MRYDLGSIPKHNITGPDWPRLAILASNRGARVALHGKEQGPAHKPGPGLGAGEGRCIQSVLEHHWGEGLLVLRRWVLLLVPLRLTFYVDVGFSS